MATQNTLFNGKIKIDEQTQSVYKRFCENKQNGDWHAANAHVRPVVAFRCRRAFLYRLDGRYELFRHAGDQRVNLWANRSVSHW